MKPVVITREGQAKTAPRRWAEQYPPDKADADKVRIGRRLNAAKNTPQFNASLVDAIIGNKSWTEIRCDACGKFGLDVAVQVGQELDYDSATALLCKECCHEAWLAIQDVNNPWDE